MVFNTVFSQSNILIFLGSKTIFWLRAKELYSKPWDFIRRDFTTSLRPGTSTPNQGTFSPYYVLRDFTPNPETCDTPLFSPSLTLLSLLLMGKVLIYLDNTYNELYQKNRFQSVRIAALCLYNMQRENLFFLKISQYIHRLNLT